jgi:hypothetical protein
MFPPEMPQLDLPEFFGKMEEFRKIVSEVDIGTLPPEKAEFFRGLLAEFDKSAALIKAELPGELDNLRTEYRSAVAAATSEHQANIAALDEARQRQAEAPAREAERVRKLSEASAKVKEQRLMAEAAERERRFASNPKELPFSGGGELVKELQVLQAGPPAKESGQPKPTGHIWNNWDPNYQPEPGTIEKLSEDSGVVYLDPDLMRKIRSPRGE